jgi:MFS family permease
VTDDGSPRWATFTLVCLAYLATTTGESLLSPIYPIAASDLGLNLAGAGTAFFVLALSIAAANLVGGLLLRWWSANHVLAMALLSTATGCLVAATAHSAWQFFGAQIFIGVGAGLLYPAAIMSVGTFAGPDRRGFAMGVFGVFFSGGLTLAAGLAALGTRLDWRISFVVGIGLAAVAMIGVIPIRDAPRSDATDSVFSGLRAVLGAPTAIGVVGGISQYATVSFFPVFAVTVWGLTVSKAAAFLAIGRVLSIPAKLFAGWLADRVGPTSAARMIGLLLSASGLLWAVVPVVGLAIAGGVVFVAAVSGLFPLANTLAFDVAGRRGGALGAFRSLQLGAGALAGLVIGWSSQVAGLRPTVAVVTLLPLSLMVLRPPIPEANVFTAAPAHTASEDRRPRT